MVLVLKARVTKCRTSTAPTPATVVTTALCLLTLRLTRHLPVALKLLPQKAPTKLPLIN